MFAQWYFGSDLPTWALLLEIVLAGLVVIISATRFTRQADVLAKRLNLGGVFMGVILLATVTSLPEVVTSITATRIGNIDLALAGLFGSCSFNITLIVLMNAVIGGGSVLRHGSGAQTLASSFGLILMTLALSTLLVADGLGARTAAAETAEAGGALLIVIAYLTGTWLVYRYETVNRDPDQQQTGQRSRLGWGLPIQLVFTAAVIMFSAWWLARCGDVLSGHEIPWLGRPVGATFVGAIFLAIATSLPEVTTSLAAIRIGNLNLALGNIFGSNMFNIFVIPMMKVTAIASGHSTIFEGDGFHMRPALLAGMLPILMTGIVVGGLTYRSKRRFWRRFGLDSVLLAATYIGGVLLLMLI